MKYSFVLLFTAAFLGACSHDLPESASLAASPFHIKTDDAGFSLLWEANEKRCTKTVENETVYYKNCRRFEMQTPLYNSQNKPRPLDVHLRFICEAQGQIPFNIAVAKKPVAVVMNNEKLQITNAWQQEQIYPQAETLHLRMELPPREKAMFVAMLDPFSAQTVKAGCQISYRFVLSR